MSELNDNHDEKSEIRGLIRDQLGIIMLECSLLKNDLLKDECFNIETADDISSIEKAVGDVDRLVNALPWK